MASKKGGLGRGIGALLPQSQAQYSQTQPQDTVQEVLGSLIRPNRYQPRREFDAESLNELAESIKSYGILQPLIVRKIDDNNYELIAGERRLRASKIVGLIKVPVIIRDYTDAQMSEISIIENVQRENLNVIEEAQAYERLIKEFGHTQEVVAAKIGRSRSHISNILRLLKLSPTVRELIAKGLLTLGQARPLLAIENEVIQVQAAEMILSEGLSVRKVEAFINELKNSGLLASLTSNLEKPVLESPQNNDINNSNDRVDTDQSSDKINIVELKAKDDVKKSSENVTTAKQKTVSKRTEDINTQNDDIIYTREAEDKLTEILGAQVKITMGKNFGRIQIDFATEEDLSRIIESFDQKLSKVSSESKSSSAVTKEEKIAALRRFSNSQNFSI